MVLFFQIMLTMFIAEMGDKTQLLMIAMTSRYKLRDIIIGSVASILALNALAVALGALISEIIPTWLIKLIAGAAFFYFSWSTLRGGDDEEKERSGVGAAHPILSVFGTFFLAELGDKTQLTAITFAASGGAQNAVTVWLACSIGLFAADLIGMLLGYLLKKNTSGNFLSTVAFIIFAVFGFTTVAEGLGLLLGGGALRWAVAVIVAAVFALLCLLTWRGKTRER